MWVDKAKSLIIFKLADGLTCRHRRIGEHFSKQAFLHWSNNFTSGKKELKSTQQAKCNDS